MGAVSKRSGSSFSSGGGRFVTAERCRDMYRKPHFSIHVNQDMYTEVDIYIHIDRNVHADPDPSIQMRAEYYGTRGTSISTN